jgi:Flp pilus assembly pilin Flp
MPARERGIVMMQLYVRLWSRFNDDERGQGTIEYVLVMLAVTAVAVVLVSWAKSGSGKSTLSGLFEDIIGWVSGAARKLRF